MIVQVTLQVSYFHSVFCLLAALFSLKSHLYTSKAKHHYFRKIQ